jgi:hypothetical protein
MGSPPQMRARRGQKQPHEPPRPRRRSAPLLHRRDALLLLHALLDALDRVGRLDVDLDLLPGQRLHLDHHAAAVGWGGVCVGGEGGEGVCVWGGGEGVCGEGGVLMGCGRGLETRPGAAPLPPWPPVLGARAAAPGPPAAGRRPPAAGACWPPAAPPQVRRQARRPAPSPLTRPRPPDKPPPPSHALAHRRRSTRWRVDSF